MSGAMLGAAGIAGATAGEIKMSLSGSLSATSGTGTVTSSTRTVTVPAGNSGVFRFENYQDTGTVTTTQYSRNGGAFQTIADGNSTEVFSNGDTIAVRTNSVGSGEARAFAVVDSTTGQYVEQNVIHAFA